jgi:HlyD family secretion protein
MNLPSPTLVLLTLFLVSGCNRHPAALPADQYAGYADADPVTLASSAAGRIARIYVQRGERVAAGAPLFALEGQAPRTAPAELDVADVMAREGETVKPAQPVLALLAPGQVRARFFVSDEQAAALAPGRPVVLDCAACGAGLAATISYVARQAEPGRTAPAFMVEAMPGRNAPSLHAGQPLTVRLVR